MQLQKTTCVKIDRTSSSSRSKANVIPVEKMIEVSKDPRFGNTKALLLFENPEDVLRVVEGGVDIQEVNVGSMAHSVGKVVVSKVLSMVLKTLKRSKN